MAKIAAMKPISILPKLAKNPCGGLPTIAGKH